MIERAEVVEPEISWQTSGLLIHAFGVHAVYLVAAIRPCRAR